MARRGVGHHIAPTRRDFLSFDKTPRTGRKMPAEKLERRLGECVFQYNGGKPDARRRTSADFARPALQTQGRDGRVLKCEWVEKLYRECVAANTTFCLIDTGTRFERNGRIYNLPDKKLQSKMAYKSGYYFEGRKAEYKLKFPPRQTELFFGESES